MIEPILDELAKIERDRGVHIVNARERGSRMLCVPHNNSDWDVMFVFAQEAPTYAQFNGYIDTIHEPHLGEGGKIDLHGWNIDKFGSLLADSNPNALEYCSPSYEYIASRAAGWEPMAQNALDNFNHMDLYNHYISMAKRNWTKYVDSGSDRTKGRQFYIARATACAKYIRCLGSFPPLNVFELCEELHPHENNRLNNLCPTLTYLAREKRRGNGDDEYDDVVGRFYKTESEVPIEPTDERTSQPDTELIDDFIAEAMLR